MNSQCPSFRRRVKEENRMALVRKAMRPTPGSHNSIVHALCDPPCDPCSIVGKIEVSYDFLEALIISILCTSDSHIAKLSYHMSHSCHRL